MEDFKFKKDDIVKFTNKNGEVVEGKVESFKYKPLLMYVIAHKNGEPIYKKDTVENTGELVEQRSELHSVRGGNKEKIFTYYIMPSKRRQNNKKNSKKNNKSRNQRGGDITQEVKTIVSDLDAKVDELKEKVEMMPVMEETPNDSKGEMKIDELDESKGESNGEEDDESNGEEDDDSKKMSGGRRRTHKKNRNNKKNKKNRKSQRRQRRR